jgi:hypothetical protein
MSSRKNIQQLRGIPAPIGTPPIIYVPYIFGNMKPIPFIPASITLTTAPQTFGTVFLPRNSVAQFKLIIVRYNVIVLTVLPNQPGGPVYTESMQIPGVGSTGRLAPFTVPAVPSTYEAYCERFFFYDSINVFELNASGPPPTNSTSNVDGTNHNLVIPNFAGPFDPTIDNQIEFQIMTSFLGSTDTVQVEFGDAFIQSPLDLRRLPR